MAKEAFHAFLSGLAPHLQEHVGVHVQGDLEAVMAMAQRLEVYRGAGDRAKAGGAKKGSEKVQKRNKKGAALTVQGNEKEEVVQVIQNQPKKRARARARGVHNSSRKRRSTSWESASTVEEITSSGTARSGKRCVRNSAPRETSCLAPFAHTNG